MYLFCKNEETTLALLRKLHTVCAFSTKFIRTQPGNKVESFQNASHYTQNKFYCDVLKNKL